MLSTGKSTSRPPSTRSRPGATVNWRSPGKYRCDAYRTGRPHSRLTTGASSGVTGTLRHCEPADELVVVEHVLAKELRFHVHELGPGLAVERQQRESTRRAGAARRRTGRSRHRRRPGRDRRADRCRGRWATPRSGVHRRSGRRRPGRSRPAPPGLAPPDRATPPAAGTATGTSRRAGPSGPRRAVDGDVADPIPEDDRALRVDERPRIALDAAVFRSAAGSPRPRTGQRRIEGLEIDDRQGAGRGAAIPVPARHQKRRTVGGDREPARLTDRVAVRHRIGVRRAPAREHGEQDAHRAGPAIVGARHAPHDTATRVFARFLGRTAHRPTVGTMLCLGLLAASSPTAWIQLGALVAGAAGFAVLVRRRRAAGPRPLSIPLTGQHSVHVVEAAGQRLVIGTGPGAAPSLLCRLDAAASAPSPAGPSTGSSPVADPSAEPSSHPIDGRAAVAVRPLPNSASLSR